MGCIQSDTQSWENCAGVAEGLYPYPGLSPAGLPDSIYDIVSTRNNGTGNPGFVKPCSASLRARGLIYYKKTPGDCGSGPGAAGIGSGQIVGLSGQAASGVIGGLGVAGVLSGPATLGIGTAVSLAVAGISQIFSHHAQAVADEQGTICSVVNYFNPICKQIDAAVASGQISPDQGVVYMKQVCLQAINGLQTIYNKCNAACYYQSYLRAHADFVSSFYPYLSPIGPAAGAQAPASAPTSYGTPPGAVPDAGAVAPIRSSSNPAQNYLPAGPPAVTAPSGSAPLVTPNKLLPSGNYASTVDYLNVGYNQQTGQSAQAADVPALTLSPTMVLVAAAVIIALVVFL